MNWQHREISFRRGSVTIRASVGQRGTLPILFLHGLTFDRNCMAELVPRLPRFVHAWAPDFRGHGRSDRCRGPYRYSDLVDDTLTMIQDVIGQPTGIFGHSLGGAVALAAAAQGPELVCGLIISDNFLTRDSFGSAVRDPMIQALFGGLHGLAGGGAGPQLEASLSNLELPSPAGEGVVRLGDLPGMSSTLLGLWSESLACCDGAVTEMLFDPLSLSTFDGEDFLRRITCPLLLLQADPAAGGMLSDGDVALARKFRPDLQSRCFPGIGHFMHMQDPESTAVAVTDFITAEVKGQDEVRS